MFSWKWKGTFVLDWKKHPFFFFFPQQEQQEFLLLQSWEGLFETAELFCDVPVDGAEGSLAEKES